MAAVACTVEIMFTKLVQDHGNAPNWAQVQANPEKAMEQVLALSGGKTHRNFRTSWNKSASCAWNSKMCKI